MRSLQRISEVPVNGISKTQLASTERIYALKNLPYPLFAKEGNFVPISEVVSHV